MLYHGLVGSTPDNQRSFREVKEDIHQALANGSSVQLSVFLKLQPLWWEERLQKIFAEVDAQQASAVLLPDLSESVWPDQADPLGHPDWRVRANAARVLAFLHSTRADERMCRSLRDTADSAKAAFCHLAYSLGALATTPAKDALIEFIEAEEPWFRVDAAGALALSKRDDVLPDLAKALFSDHVLTDYTAVAIASHRKVTDFVAHDNESCRDAGFVMALNLVRASQQTFNSDVVNDNDVPASLPLMIQLYREQPSALRLLAICEITDWVNAPDSVFSTATAPPDAIVEVQQLVQSDAAKTAILAALSDPSNETERSLERRSAIVLAGRLKQADASSQLLKSLHEKNDLEQVIEAIGALGDPKLAHDLVQLARRTVDVKDRTSRVLSPQPVAEDDEQSAKTYWRILRSLGNLPAPDAVQLLVEAVGDFAPDKREQALLSLIQIQSLQPSLVSHNQANQAIEKGLHDANASMRVAALIGAGKGAIAG